jgi:hypothetical protein
MYRWMSALIHCKATSWMVGGWLGFLTCVAILGETRLMDIPGHSLKHGWRVMVLLTMQAWKPGCGWYQWAWRDDFAPEEFVSCGPARWFWREPKGRRWLWARDYIFG